MNPDGSSSGKGNVPDSTEVLETDYYLLSIAAAAAGPASGATPDELDTWLQNVARVAAQVRPRVNGIAGFLAQRRACDERTPIKGVITDVRRVTVAEDRNGRPLEKVEVTYQPTAGRRNTTNLETIRSDWLYKPGFTMVASDWKRFVGSECLLYRYLEATGSPTEPTAKVLVEIRPLNKTPITNSNPNSSSSTPRPPRSAVASNTPASPEEVLDLATSQLEMPREQVVAFAVNILGPPNGNNRGPHLCALLWRALDYLAGTCTVDPVADRTMLEQPVGSANKLLELVTAHLDLPEQRITEVADAVLPPKDERTGEHYQILWRILLHISPDAPKAA